MKEFLYSLNTARCNQSMGNCVRVNIKETYYYKPIYMHEDDNCILRLNPPVTRILSRDILGRDIHVICKDVVSSLCFECKILSYEDPVILKFFYLSSSLSLLLSISLSSYFLVFSFLVYIMQHNKQSTDIHRNLFLFFFRNITKEA